jgi:hypothetical protein
MNLTQHRSGTAHLPHQPFDGVPPLIASRHEFSIFFRQVQHDRAAFHQMHARLIVDDRGDAIVGRDFQKFGIELLSLRNIDRVNAIGDAQFFKHDGDLAAVRRRPCVEVDHSRSLRSSGACSAFVENGTRPE